MCEDCSSAVQSELSSCSACLKDLNNLIKSFWFLIAALWRSALSAVSHCMTSTALSRCWDRLQKCAHFDSTSVQPQRMSAHYATDDSLSFQQNWEGSWWSTLMRYSQKKQFSDVSIMHLVILSSKTAWCIKSLLHP